MALTTQQTASVASYWANVNFVMANATAVYPLDQIEAAASALDAAFDTTLSAQLQS